MLEHQAGREVWQDEDALRETVLRLRAFAARQTRSDGEDLAQEALVRALEHGIDATALPWLITVTRNLVIDKSRRHREFATAHEQLDVVGGTEAGPEEAALEGDLTEQLRTALQELPPRYRQALLTYMREGATIHVASGLGISPGAAWTLLHRARCKLRRLLKERGVLPAIFAARGGDWLGRLAPAGLAVGVAITMGTGSVPSAAGPPFRPPAQAVGVVQNTAADPVPVTRDTHGAPTSSRVPDPAAAVTPPPVPDASRPIEVATTACPPPDASITPVTVQVWFEDDEQDTLTDDAVGLAGSTLPIGTGKRPGGEGACR